MVLIPLDQRSIGTLARPLESELDSSLGENVDFTFDLDKELRFKNYPVIQLLLMSQQSNPYASTSIPKPLEEFSKKQNAGFMYLFDGKQPHYMQDGVAWKKTRMSVKLIVFNSNKGMYKLKNHKNDDGEPIMRRQTWQSKNGIRKHEYKLINRSIGHHSDSSHQNLFDFPLLVHYFQKKDSDDSEDTDDVEISKAVEVIMPTPPPSQRGRKRKAPVSEIIQQDTKRVAIGPTTTTTTLSSSIPSSNLNLLNPTVSTSFLNAQNNNNNNIMPLLLSNNGGSGSGSGTFKKPLGSEANKKSNDPLMVTSQTTTTTTTQSNTTTFVGRREVFDPLTIGPISPSMIPAPPDFDLSPLDVRWVQSPNSPGSILNNTWKQIKREDSLEHMVGAATSPSSMLFSTSNSDIQSQDLQQISSSHSSTQSASSSHAPPKSSVPPFVTLPPNATLQIVTYSPDVAPAASNTKVIAVVEKIDQSTDSSRKQFNAIFEGIEVPAVQIAPGVIEFYTPRHTAGPVMWWISIKDLKTKEIQNSNALPFCFTPVDDTGRLNLTNYNLNSDWARDILFKFRYTVKELDLANNVISDFDYLSEFPHLHTLIMDSNQVAASSKMGKMMKLVVLSLNMNQITELETFINELSGSAPNLQFLSLLGNSACPFFEGPHRYYNYRIYVISKFPKLTHLDSAPVSAEERRHSSSLQ